MSDPLSLAASIGGLISLAGQLYTALDGAITGMRDAPSLARTIHAEINVWRNTLVTLQKLLSGNVFTSDRASLIPADHVVLCFTDAVLLFSELESVILPLAESRVASLANRARWARQGPRLTTLVTRLQWHKSTLLLQLNMLQW
jgi:hypothetical protein